MTDQKVMEMRKKMIKLVKPERDYESEQATWDESYLTVDKLMAKLRKMKKEGKLTGKERIVTDFGESLTREAKATAIVQTRIVRFPHTIESENGEPDFFNRGVCEVVDGRGRPKGTEKVVRLT